MLESNDLLMIEKIVTKAVAPIREDVGTLKEDVSELKKDVGTLKEDVSGLKEDVSTLNNRVVVLENNAEETKNGLNDLKGDVKNVQLTLENDINKEIRIIAEGHLDLDRKLNKALVLSAEKEMLNLRVTHLEIELAKVKEKAESIA